MDWKVFAALVGWILVLLQFYIRYSEAKSKNESELLEKTLNYFEKDYLSRAIGISLVQGIWLKRKTNLEIIVPVLVSQLHYLLTRTDTHEAEARNIIRMLFLLEKTISFAEDPRAENIEILNALLVGVENEKGLGLSKATLKHWFKIFNEGDTKLWEAEVEDT